MKKLEHVYLSIEENRDGILLHLQDTIPVLRKRERGSYTAGRMTGQMRYDRILHGERDENGQVSHRVGEINYAPAIPVQGTRYVSAKYCYITHELRLHQNDRCKRFTPV